MPDPTLTQDPALTFPTLVDPVNRPADPPGFELLAEVGRGGMGVVYRARDLALSREVAVKVLAADPSARAGSAGRFLEEARITARLQHPGIPAVYQVGTTTDGRPFLAMKLIRGQTLAERLAFGQPVDRLAVIEAVAQAVGYAHAEGVIHRDLKPANVMVGAFGEVQVMDWGVAKQLGGDHPERPATDTPAPAREFTRAGSVVGTPAYMSPEQAAGDPTRVDRRSDVFGLGAVLCALLTGQPPYLAEDAVSTHERAARGDLGDAFARLDASGADPDVIALCRRCLSRDSADRPADGAAVAEAVAALRRAADDRARQAERDRLAAQVQTAEARKRRRAGLWAAATLVAVLLTGVATTSIGLIQATVAKRAAETAHLEAVAGRAEAVAAKQAEAALRAKAETKEKETASVLQFFLDRVVAAARPKGSEGGLGPDVKVRDALTAGLAAIPQAFADQPLVEARLRLALGKSFLLLGEPATAEQQATRARQLFTAARGADDPDTLSALTVLGDSLYFAGKRPAALALKQEAVDRLTAALGADSPETLYACSSLAFSLQMAGRHDDAFRLREQTAERMAKTLGPDHPSTLDLLGHVAAGYTQRGRHDDAIRLHRQAVAGLTAKLGPDHAATLAATNNLAVGLDAAGRIAETLAVQEDTLARRRKALGPDHPSTLVSLNNLAAGYAKTGRYKEAVDRGEEVVKLRTAKLGRDHASTLKSMGNLADAYGNLGRLTDALALWTELVDRMTAAQPPDFPDLLPATRRLSEALVQAGRGDEAVRRVDAGLARAGKAARRSEVEKLLDIRLKQCEATGDAAGCRATAEKWEAAGPADADDRFTAACFRAVSARAYAKAGQPAESAADGDRAVRWLAQAVAGGFTDRSKIDGEPDLSAIRKRADYQALVAPLAEPAPPPREGPGERGE